tara:strand:+ start:2561 stop:3223 length:663 start_codon:yes stop_codon:yes gene_type:complete
MDNSSNTLKKEKENDYTNKIYKGLYENFTITKDDILGVKIYRYSLTIASIAINIGLIQLLLFDSKLSLFFLILITLSLGFSVKYIHIYLDPIHKLLWFLWISGCIGLTYLITISGLNELIPSIIDQRYRLLFIGPIFGVLSGIGFKEFFCFRRIEAIGVTFFTPVSILSYSFNIFNEYINILFIVLAAISSLILAIKKLGFDFADDIGDKSIFKYLSQKN